MGSTALLTISQFEDPTRIIDALAAHEVTYFPRTSDDAPETELKVGVQRFYGEEDILREISDLDSSK